MKNRRVVSREMIELYARLRLGRVEEALLQMQTWLPGATYSDISHLIDSCPATQREHLVALIQDVLTGYPDVLWGCPVLIRYNSDGCDSLPLQLPECPPHEVIVSISWLPLSMLRDGEPMRPHRGVVNVHACNTTCAVLLMRTRGPEAPLAPEGEWFGDALEGRSGDQVYASGKLVLPWPAAVEAGCVQHAYTMSGDGATDMEALFLNSDARAEAIETGLGFRRMLHAL
jgi:hypothetical protein